MNNILDALSLSLKRSVRDHKELLDFEEPIKFDDIQPIVDTLRELGIAKFTISARQENLIEILSEFQKLGVKGKEIAEFTAHRVSPNGKEKGWYYDAILMEIGTINQLRAKKIRAMWCDAQSKIFEVAEATEEAINAKEYDDEVELEDLNITLETCSALIQILNGD